MAVFFLVDIAFFAANISKILHGSWFPLLIGAAAFTLLGTWQKGRASGSPGIPGRLARSEGA